MPAYKVPRDTRGEGRILYIFSTKGLIFTFVGLLIGAIFYFIFDLIGLTFIGVIFLAIFGLIGFSIATFKVPNIKTIDITKKVGGEKIDEVLTRAIKFKRKKVKKYTLFTKEEEINE